MRLNRRLITALLCLILMSLCSIAAAQRETEIRIGVYEPMTGGPWQLAAR